MPAVTVSDLTVLPRVIANPTSPVRRVKSVTTAPQGFADRSILAAHYAEHEGKPFYEPLVEFMMSGPVVAIIAEGNRVIEGFRKLAGATDPTVAEPGTIRGDLARDQGTKVVQNIVHRSDSVESATREIGIWFATDVTGLA